MAFLLVQFGPEAAQILRILRLFVGFTGFALADTFIVVQPVVFKPSANNFRLIASKFWPYRLPCCFCQRSIYLLQCQ
jgi:hypothetical protein